MNCRKCKEVLLAGSAFCSKCGAPQGGASRQPAPPARVEALRNCPDCHGRGEVREDCSRCEGTGREGCVFCEGTGRYYGSSDNRCPHCRGRGEMDHCDSCASRGYDLSPCGTCDGTGQLTHAAYQALQERREEQARREEEARKREVEAVHQRRLVAERKRAEEAERQRAEDAKRKQAEAERQRLADEEARRRAKEEARRKMVMQERLARKECVLCGDRLGFLARLTGQTQHDGCDEFTD